MDVAARRAEHRCYRWRGDGLTREPESIDYLHGPSVIGSTPMARGNTGASHADGQRLLADSRLIHWDLLESDDAPSRTA
jgi:hypothetical protein